LGQDQYLEVRTLLSGYLLASQGDRMLMAHSVEGRFPYLDSDLAAIADGLPPELKLRGLDEKHILKRVARDLVPAGILSRPKQPYRAPDALAFVTDRPDWVDELLGEQSVRAAGVFDPAGVTRLWRKCQAAAERGRLSNTDDMAIVGVLSTGLLHHRFIGGPTPDVAPVRFHRYVDAREGAALDIHAPREGLPV
jgi:asparagine synthase (glutamine-hydrolysing)